jgi:hypothetical protein
MVLESGKNQFRILDPGVKKPPDPGSQIRIRNTGYHIVIDFNPFRECTTTLRDCVPLLMNYDVLRSQFEWLINGDSIETHVQDNLGTQLTVLEKFLR